MIASQVGTDRIGLLAAGPDLAGFCRTGTGGFRVKYKAAGSCRILPDLAGKFKFIFLFLYFCHYHVELHNKIVSN